MTTRAERQALDVSYGGNLYERPGNTTHEVLAIPDEWRGKYVDFELVDTTNPDTNISHVKFGTSSSVEATISPTVSVVTSFVMAPVVSGGSHVRLHHGRVVPIRIPVASSTAPTHLSHIEGIATGRLKMTLSTGDGN
jgi:hypothetical protein